MDFRTRIANQMGSLLLANLEAVQATEDAQVAIAQKDAQLAEAQAKFDAAVDKRDDPSGAPAPAA
jgi:hypothetical protein